MLSAMQSNHLWVIVNAIDLELIFQSLSIISNNAIVCLYGTPCDEVKVDLEKISFSKEPCLKEYEKTEWTYLLSFKGIQKLKNESFHIILNKGNQKILVGLANKNARMDVCTDLVLYEKERVLLEVSDAGHQPILLNGNIPERLVKQLSIALKGEYMTYSNFMEDN